MTEHFLSENLEEWPQDPFDMFGLAPGADERALRKAYHRLIKKFKPEHYPDQFRRLNESYESLKPYLKFHQQNVTIQDDETHWPDESEDDWPSSTYSSVRASEDDSNNRTDLIETAWKRVSEEPSSGAVADLERLLDDAPYDEELVLRTFWAMKFSDKSNSISPIELLEKYLLQAGLLGRVFQLYLMELNRIPKLAEAPRVRELLLESATDSRLTELTRAIWLGCRRLNQSSLINEDLKLLRDEVAYDSPEIWKQLLYQAAEILALHGVPRNDDSIAEIVQELRACENNLDEDWYDRRWEMVEHLVYETDRSVHSPSDLFQFVKQTMLRDDGDLKRKFQERVTRWTNEKDSLWLLDTFHRYSPVAVFLLTRYADGLREDYSHQYRDNYEEHLQPRVRDFFQLYEDEPYEIFRAMAAQWCAAEDVPVDSLLNLGMQLAASQPNSARWFTDDNVRRLNDDHPLRCLVACQRAMLE